jgi:hypothetical protein
MEVQRITGPLVVLFALGGPLLSCDTVEQAHRGVAGANDTLVEIRELGDSLDRFADDLEDWSNGDGQPTGQTTAPTPTNSGAGSGADSQVVMSTVNGDEAGDPVFPDSVPLSFSGSGAASTVMILDETEGHSPMASYWPIALGDAGASIREFRLDNDGSLWATLATKYSSSGIRSADQLVGASYRDDRWTVLVKAGGRAGVAPHGEGLFEIQASPDSWEIRQWTPGQPGRTVLRYGDDVPDSPGYKARQAGVVQSAFGMAVIEAEIIRPGTSYRGEKAMLVMLPTGEIMSTRAIARTLGAPAEEIDEAARQMPWRSWSLSPHGVVFWEGIFVNGRMTGDALILTTSGERLELNEQSRWLSDPMPSEDIRFRPSGEAYRVTSPDGWVWGGERAGHIVGFSSSGALIQYEVPADHELFHPEHHNYMKVIDENGRYLACGNRPQSYDPVLIEIDPSGESAERFKLSGFVGQDVPGVDGFVFADDLRVPIDIRSKSVVVHARVAEKSMDPEIVGEGVFAISGGELVPLLTAGMEVRIPGKGLRQVREWIARP